MDVLFAANDYVLERRKCGRATSAAAAHLVRVGVAAAGSCALEVDRRARQSAQCGGQVSRVGGAVAESGSGIEWMDGAAGRSEIGRSVKIVVAIALLERRGGCWRNLRLLLLLLVELKQLLLLLLALQAQVRSV